MNTFGPEPRDRHPVSVTSLVRALSAGVCAALGVEDGVGGAGVRAVVVGGVWTGGAGVVGGVVGAPPWAATSVEAMNRLASELTTVRFIACSPMELD
jgi:hypothetical protein